MLVYMMRHGTAAKSGPWSDADRPLHSQGEKEIERAARGLASLEIGVPELFTSPALRCRSSAEIVAQALHARVRVLEALAGGLPAARLLRELGAAGRSEVLFLLGHEPDLVNMASTLLGDAKSAALRWGCGGCACFEVDALPPTRAAVLQWLMTPAQLGMLASS